MFCRVLNTPLRLLLSRSSRSQMFFKIDVLKNFSIFTGKHLCWSLFFIKLFIKEESPTQAFSCEYCEILMNRFFYRTPSVAACGFHVGFIIDLFFFLKVHTSKLYSKIYLIASTQHEHKQQRLKFSHLQQF